MRPDGALTSIEPASASLPYFLPAQPLDDTSIIAISALAFIFLYIICLAELPFFQI